MDNKKPGLKAGFFYAFVAFKKLNAVDLPGLGVKFYKTPRPALKAISMDNVVVPFNRHGYKTVPVGEHAGVLPERWHTAVSIYPLILADIAGLVRLCETENQGRAIPRFVENESVSSAFIRLHHHDLNNDARHRCMVIQKHSAVIGFSWAVERRSESDERPCFEAGVFVGQQHRRQGIATRALRRIAHKIISDVPTAEIYGEATDLASRALLAKTAFTTYQGDGIYGPRLGLTRGLRNIG